MRSSPATISTLVAVVTLSACGGGSGAVTPTLPENIAAEPRGLVGIIQPSPTSMLPTALRALGVPYLKLAHEDLEDVQLDSVSLVIVDEGALDDPAVPHGLPRLLDHMRTSALHVLMLVQPSERGREVLRINSAPVDPRPIAHGIELVAPDRSDRILLAPNAITPTDIEAYSERTKQLVRGKNSRAVLAGNLDSPDSSAAVVRATYGKGAMWYVAFEITARAAEGYAADQRMLANLLSVGSRD